MATVQRATLKAYSEDTVLRYQLCPDCGRRGFLNDPAFSLLTLGDPKCIGIKIGEQECFFTPEPGTTEVRLKDKMFQIVKLEETPGTKWHNCSKIQGVEAKSLVSQ